MNQRFYDNERIGEYRITGFLGVGGMGEVYQAFHDKLNRLVAVKVLAENANSSSDFKERFFNEARLQANLQHPNIVLLYDFQEVRNQLVIFMEYVDGFTLDDLISHNALAVEDSVRIFKSIAEALSYIHSQGVVHRDLKPQNIKINSNSQVKLLDFGIAKGATSKNLTKTGGVIGTPHYLAPEQLKGEAASIQTDIWSLGVIFYKMLTGVEPFQGENFAALFSAIGSGTFPVPERFNPAVPKNISNIALKCLQRDKYLRYQSVSEVLADVDSVISPQSNSSENASYAPISVSSDKPKSSFGLTVLFASVGLVLLGGFIGILFLVFIGGEKPQSQKAVSSPSPIVQTQNLPAQTNRNITVSSSEEPTNITVKIDVIDGKTEVWRNGLNIGATPLDITVGEKEKIILVLKREGYQEKPVEFEATKGKRVYTYSLTPK